MAALGAGGGSQGRRGCAARKELINVGAESTRSIVGLS